MVLNSPIQFYRHLLDNSCLERTLLLIVALTRPKVLIQMGFLHDNIGFLTIIAELKTSKQ